MSDEVIKPSDNSLALTLRYDNKRMYLEFNEGCLKQDKFTYNHGKIVNIYIVYDLKSTVNYDADFTLENYFFGALKLTKNADVDKYKYFGYGIRFILSKQISPNTGTLLNGALRPKLHNSPSAS